MEKPIIVEVEFYPDGNIVFIHSTADVVGAMRIYEKRIEQAFKEGQESVVNNILKNIETLAKSKLNETQK